ncbi:MAG: hypothetical protein JXQ23_03575 [Clostridia bacterium]|nr:hypothetical protein [Clostridia bacterium]
MKFKKQEVITSLLIIVILSLCISTFMNFHEFNGAVRDFNKMLRKGEYVNLEQTDEFLNILFDSHYPFEVSIAEKTMTLTVEVPDGSGMPLEIERWFYPTLLFAESVIILDRFPDIDMIDYALARNDNVILYDSVNRKSIVEITGIEIENMIASSHDYYQWEEISRPFYKQKKLLESKE